MFLRSFLHIIRLMHIEVLSIEAQVVRDNDDHCDIMLRVPMWPCFRHYCIA